MKEYSSEIFGNIKMPESLLEVLQLITYVPEYAYTNVYMWRGQADVSWPIHSGAYRRIFKGNGKVSPQSLVYYEKDLLDRATHRGFRIHDGQELSDFELLASLQHHGAATRLIDFTKNSLVALYFAVSTNMDSIGALLGVHTDELGGIEERIEKRSYDEIVQKLEEIEHPITWEPPAVTMRIAAQRSQFLYSGLSHSKAGSLRIENLERELFVIAIDPELKRECLIALSSTFDIRHTSLFPDLDGFGAANSSSHQMWDRYRW